jgi:hypothetical protein
MLLLILLWRSKHSVKLQTFISFRVGSGYFSRSRIHNRESRRCPKSSGMALSKLPAATLDIVASLRSSRSGAEASDVTARPRPSSRTHSGSTSNWSSGKEGEGLNYTLDYLKFLFANPPLHYRRKIFLEFLFYFVWNVLGSIDIFPDTINIFLFLYDQVRAWVISFRMRTT